MTKDEEKALRHVRDGLHALYEWTPGPAMYRQADMKRRLETLLAILDEVLPEREPAAESDPA